MAVLDSDILVGLLRGDAQAKKKIEETIKNNEAIATTTINSFELFKGAFLSKRWEENLKEVHSLLQNLKILAFDYKASFVCSQKFRELSEKKITVPLADLMIASITISQGEIIITRNKKDFSPVSGLELDAW